MVNGNLPDGWMLTTLGEIAELIGGGTPSREHPEYFGGKHVWLTPTEIPRNRVTVISTSREQITDEGLKKSSARLLPKGTVLMTSRASIGYVAIAGTEVTTNQGFASFICRDGVYNHFLAYWLLGNADYFIEQATGTTFKEITKSKLRNFSFPLPPLPEQERIVAKIEELFTQLEAGTAALKRVRAGVKRYKASVLKAAVEGRLLPSGRSSAAPLPGDGELPDGWRWTTVGDIATKVTDGTHFTPRYVENGVPFISVNNLSLDGDIDFSDCKYITEEEHTQLYRRCNPEKSDVLLTKVGTVGLTAVIKTDKVFSLFVNTALIKPLHDIVLPEFLAYALRYGFMSKAYNESISGSTQKFIGNKKISQLSIPLPPLAEQRRIVAEVERRLSVVKEVESVAAASVARAGRLRQSVLKSAFEGRLC